MPSLQRIFNKYTGSLRSLRAVYYINNVLNARKLQHNAELYKKHGLKKSIFESISSHDFKEQVGEIPWLDRPDALQRLKKHPEFQDFDADTQAQLIQWLDNGFLILKGFYNKEDVRKINGEVDRLLAEQKTDFNYTGRKIMDAYRISPLINDYFRNPRMIKLLNFIMGQTIHPFQTINFIEGTEQKAHSDFIHMTSEPKGYLIASWTALEDTNEGNGPLFYYPGSHKLPYILSNDFESGNSRWKLGYNSYKRYEDRIADFIEEHQLKKEYFFAESGDVLLWHANLLHGGSPIMQKGSTRKSMVSHYFCEGIICYHEISQRPAMLDQ